MDDIARILGLPDFSRENEVRQRQQGYSGGFQNRFLVDVVAKHKQNLEDLREDNRELQRMAEQLRQGQSNEAHLGKMLSEEEQERLKVILRETEERFRDVEAQNRQLRSELDQRENYQSAFQSNNRAFTEKLDFMQKDLRDKDELIRKL